MPRLTHLRSPCMFRLLTSVSVWTSFPPNCSSPHCHAQMRFHHKHRRAHSIRLVLESARANAVNTFGMDASRLYVGAHLFSLWPSSNVCRWHRSTLSHLFAHHLSLNSQPCVSILCSFDLPPTCSCKFSCYQNKPCVPFQAAHDPCALKDRCHSQAVFQPRVCCQRTVGGRNEQSRRPPRQFDR